MQTDRYAQLCDETLVLRALLGDIPAYDELVRRFRRAVIFVAQQTLGSREAAEDVAQEAFLLAFKALPQLQEPAKFAGWLCAITRHRARRVAVREGRSAATEPSKMDRLILAHSQELASHPAEAVVQKSESARLLAFLSQLPADYQTVLHLRYQAEWPVARIADFLSLPITTVKWRLHQGRDLLRRRLAEQNEEKSHERQQPERYGNPAHSSYGAADRAPCGAF